MDEFLNVTVIGDDDEDETAAEEVMKVAKIRLKLRKIEDAQMKLRFTFHVGHDTMRMMRLS